MTKNVIIVDNFYSDPGAVRDLALEAELLPPGSASENFAGNESLFNYYNDDLVKKFEELVGKEIEVDEHQNTFGRFRFAQADDRRRTQIHFDDKDWSAVIYLSPLTCSRSGTIFVEHRPTRLIGPPQSEQALNALECSTIAEFDRKFVLPDTLNSSAWTIHLKVPFRFNRLVLFRGSRLFHGSEALFGQDRLSARLTQNFFFNEKSYL